MQLAERLVHHAPEEQREPVSGGGEEREDPGHAHDDVEVGDYEIGVVEILVQAGLAYDDAAEAAGYEQRDEAERIKHRRSEFELAAPKGGEPVERFYRGGDGDG